MRVVIIPKASLSDDQRESALARILAPVHAQEEVAPFQFWNLPGWENNYRAAFDAESGCFVGTVYGVLGAPRFDDVAWWVDSIKRRSGYGYALVDALRDYLRSQRVTTVGAIHFRGSNEVASSKLAARLRAYFPH